jgi:hypothetical protein
VDTEPNPEEAARRLRAAIAYVGLGQPEAAKILGTSVPTLARMLGRKGEDGIRPATWGELWRAADKLGLPRAWFVADLTRLQQIVPDDRPRFPNDNGNFKLTAAHEREAQALRREAQRSRERQQAARNTKRTRKRRRDEAD